MPRSRALCAIEQSSGASAFEIGQSLEMNTTTASDRSSPTRGSAGVPSSVVTPTSALGVDVDVVVAGVEWQLDSPIDMSATQSDITNIAQCSCRTRMRFNQSMRRAVWQDLQRQRIHCDQDPPDPFRPTRSAASQDQVRSPRHRHRDRRSRLESQQ